MVESTEALPSPIARSAVFQQFKNHCSAPRNETDSAIVDAIRAYYTGYHITTVDARQCNILEYASAGHASVELIWEGDGFYGRRTYTAPTTRLEESEGTLGDNIRFGIYSLGFQGSGLEFITAQWHNPFESSKHMNYILSPKATVDHDGHSPEADHLIMTIGKWTSQLHKEIYVFDDGHWDKSSLLWEAVQSSKWDDVIIDPAMKETLIRDVHSFFDSRALFQEYAVPWKRGIILHGTPGCGKTISIKALMNSLDKRSPPVASLYVKSFNSRAGEQFSIREIFSRARVMAPCLLIFEDLDSLVVNKVRSYFLNEVDGLENNDGILMIGSTNHLERLDPGISKRPSRFDRKYHYKLPNERERIMYCEYWKKKLERNDNVDFDPEISQIVASATEGFSFAYLKELFVQTLLTLAIGRNSDQVVETDSGEEEDKTENAEVIDVDGKTRRVPAVEIPERLQGNTLLSILRKQLLILWKDMDNTGSVPEGVKEGTDKDGEDEADLAQKDYAMQLRLLRRRNRRAE